MPAQPVQPPPDEPSDGTATTGIPALPPPDDPLGRGEWGRVVLDAGNDEAEMARRRAEAVRRFRGRPDG